MSTLQIVTPLIAYPVLIQWAQCNRQRLVHISILRDVHNLGLTIFSLWVACRLATHLAQDGRFASTHDLLCRASPLDSFLWSAWYYSKMWEWVDTLHLICAARQVSSLHYNHHLSTAPLVALQTYNRVTCTPLADVGTLINASVHVTMYLYYMLPRTLYPFKRTITALQIVQHAVMLIGFAYAFTNQNVCDAPALQYLASTLVYAMYFAQFVYFYARTYVWTKKTI